MKRTWIVWIVLPVLSVFLFGCPKKKPDTPAEDLNVNTTTVPSTPTTTPTQDIDAPDQPATVDETEDPLSGDLAAVNDELRRRGFSPDIYFEYDEASLSDESRSRLQRNADVLRSVAQFSVTIEGHADERGTNEYNLALGERRATAVREYLTSLGVAADRLRTLSYGEERPVCTTSDESCLSQNRRAHMVITGRTSG